MNWCVQKSAIFYKNKEWFHLIRWFWYSFNPMVTAKHTLDEIIRLALERGGKCLSEELKSVHKKLIWECAKGHQWEATPNHIRMGTWCPKCVRKMKTT